MKIAVIGSGLIGLTTAFFLRCRGYEVTVFDRQEGAGQEASFANGGLLTSSMPEPWNTPGCWRVLLASLGRSDRALQLRLRTVPELASWGFTFLRNSRALIHQRNTLSNLRLATYSLQVMRTLVDQSRIDYGRSALGTLKVFRNSLALDRASEAASRLANEGLRFRKLSRAETVDLEPALEPIAAQLVGALYYGDDEAGDAYQFCVGLAEHARRQGVEFRFRTEVSSLEIRSGRVKAVLSDREPYVADQYIVAAGSYSTCLLRSLGVEIPVQPARGYSVTFNHQSGKPVLRVPIVDEDWHAAVTPLEGAIRVAGTAEFAGFDLSLRPERVANLVTLAHGILPNAGLDVATAKPWCGLRPMSADGVPLIGPTAVSNLWLNTGHGHLGWTMAAGSAQLIADLLNGQSPGIAPAPYDPSRFSRI